jgi:hypothetical protein
MTTTRVGYRWHPGTDEVPAVRVHTTPLGYDRGQYAAGAQLPVVPSAELTERLLACRELIVAFHGKLGDTLLALSAVRALTDWLALRHGPGTIPVRAVGPHRQLILRTGLPTLDLDDARTPTGDGQVLVVDQAGIAARGHQAAVSVICDPAGPPCWASGGIAHEALPMRYYLGLERRLGQRLPGTPPVAPLLTARPSHLTQSLEAAGWFDGLTLGAITATSWPQLKDYTEERYIELAQHLARHLRRTVHLLLIGGNQPAPASPGGEQAHPHVRLHRLDGVPADHLVDVFAHCDLVVGNDTGLTHLAALSRRDDGTGPHVIALYARHSHSKWRTGWPHHHAVATGFSERMHQGDLCPVRDAITPTHDADLTAITPEALAETCLALLDGSSR